MKQPTVLDNHGNVVSGKTIAAIRTHAAYDTAYEGAGYRHKDLRKWRARKTSGQSGLDYERDTLTDRIHDIARNDGWASVAMDRQVDMVVGSGWNLSARIKARDLGIDDDAALELSENIEAEWELFSKNPQNYADRQRQRTVNGNIALAYRHRISDGEALGVIFDIERGGHYNTALDVVDPQRLCQPYGHINSEEMRDGVEMDTHGAAVAYHFLKSHPADYRTTRQAGYEWERVLREHPWGRPIVLHFFDAKRAGQVRGEPPLAPILRKFRQVTRYDDVELQASTLNAIMAAFITSPFDHEALADAQGLDGIEAYNKARAAFHDESELDIPGAQTGFLYAGESAQLTKPEHPNSVYENYIRAALRNIASVTGMSYEQLSMDWSGVNYSSARAALLEIWKIMTSRRERFIEQFMTPFYYAWLEEAFGTGRLKAPAGAPSFEAAAHLYARAKWIGQGRGWIDPLKEAQAAIARIDAGLSTLEDELAEQGKDFREHLERLVREQRMFKQAGLTQRQPIRMNGMSSDQVMVERE